MISPDMVLTSTPPASIWGDEVSLTLELAPSIVSPPFNIIHLNPKPYLLLTPKFAKYFFPQALNQKKSLPPIDIIFDVNNILVWPHKLLWGPSLVFLHQPFLSIRVCTYLDYVSIFPTQWYHGVIEADPFNVQSHSSLISFEQGSFTVYNSLWVPS